MIRAALLLAGLTVSAGAALAQSPAPAAPPLTPGMSETGDASRPGATMGGMAPGAPGAGGAMGGMAGRPGGMMQGGMMGGRMGGGDRRAMQERIVLEKGETRIAIGCGDADLRECMTLALQAYERMNTPIAPSGAPAR